MKFLLVFLAAFSLPLLSNVVDFGIQGKEYDIAEENGNVFIQKAIQKLDVNKINNELEKKYQALKTSNVEMRPSYEDSITVTKDVYVSQREIRNINGSIMYSKGDIIPTTLQKGARIELCFVDGSVVEPALDEIVNTFGKKCKYFVNKINVDDFEQEYKVETYPMGGQNLGYLERYGVDSLPLKIVRYEDKIETTKINLKKLLIKTASKGYE